MPPPRALAAPPRRRPGFRGRGTVRRAARRPAGRRRDRRSRRRAASVTIGRAGSASTPAWLRHFLVCEVLPSLLVNETPSSPGPVGRWLSGAGTGPPRRRGTDQRVRVGAPRPAGRPARRVQVVQVHRAHPLLGDAGGQGDGDPAALLAGGLVVGARAAQVGGVREDAPRHDPEAVPLLHEVVPAVVAHLVDLRVGGGDLLTCGA